MAEDTLRKALEVFAVESRSRDVADVANAGLELAEAIETYLVSLDEAIRRAFWAGYHAQWIRAERRWIFDPAMKPGDPEHAFEAWQDQGRP